MSQSQRQSELFAGNDWLAAYQAFSQVNLNAFDFASIRQAMVDYIRRNYPEDFNDWIESSEFVALIDLLAYLGQSIAFRTDINARENFLDTARRRESVLRLARSLSYNARRNYPARGLLKLTELRTSQDVYDSTGKNLSNLSVKWDDPNNPDWFEQWILVLNASMIETNPFGVALDSQRIEGVETQLYRLNNIALGNGSFPFTANVNNDSYAFDVVNAGFNQTFGFVEQSPSTNSPFHLIYRADGNGNSSPNTGFFLYFKQGNLQKSDYSITEPQENRMIYLDVANVNETDVWVQTVDDLGSATANGDWTRVGHAPSDEVVKVLLTTENVTYNEIDPEIQTIFQVVTQEQDRIALRFGDGRFGKSPVGNIRVWFRTSANRSINIRPEDIQGKQISVPYQASNNTQQRLTLTFSLQEAVNNSVTSESNAEIRRRASRVFSTQGRMVSGSDYNELPIQTNLAVKLKAVNRVYSGQSRYMDLNDPTGNYQNTKVFADDGAFYAIKSPEILEVNHTVASAEEMLTRYLAEVVSQPSLRDFFANELYEQIPSNRVDITNFFTVDYLSKSNVRREIRENLDLDRTFALGFNNTPDGGWFVINSGDINPDLSQPYLIDGANNWLIHCEYTSQFWRITSRGLTYVFESAKDCKFFFASDLRGIDPQTGRAGGDVISVLRLPNHLRGVALENASGPIPAPASDVILKIEAPFTYNDGFQEPSRVKVRFNDRLNDGVVDVPHTYKVLKNIDPLKNRIVHLLTLDSSGYPIERLVPRLEAGVTRLQPGELGFIEVAGHFVDIYRGNPDRLIPTTEDRVAVGLPLSQNPHSVADQRIMIREGVNDIIYQWTHFAPSSHRIDPAISNIIDIFVLTREHNDAMISWRNAGSPKESRPRVPSEINLRTTFGQLENYKMFSDEIIWRPVKFKLLFGETADAVLRAKFKVVKLQGAQMSEGEIKSQVVQIIRDFFDVNNWDFGEKFFFSELGAFIHRRLSTSISSVEIVPVFSDSFFGNLREIRCAPDELFFPTVQVSDVDIINANTPNNLRIR